MSSPLLGVPPPPAPIFPEVYPPKPGPDHWAGPVSVPVVSNLLIRNARLVPLHPGESAPSNPVDVAVTDGLVTAVSAGADRPDGAEVVDAGGRWLVPGLW